MNQFHQAVARYRECSRHVRNAYFQPPEGAPDAWEQTEGWLEVDRVLFNWMVLYPQGLKPVGQRQSHPEITLKIRGLGTSAFINQAKFKNSGSWDHPTRILRPGDCLLTFRQFFDFDELAPIDLNFVMVEISLAKDQDLNDRLALIEWQAVEFEKR
jgi:hypothetical protein